MACDSAEDKAALLKNGVSIGLQHFKVSDYTVRQTALQCYKCQGFNHVAASCDIDLKCQMCGGAHSRKDCTAQEPKCANCGGPHMSSSFACPEYAKAMVKKEATAVSYAAMVKKAGDQTDCVHLACSIAHSVHSVLKGINQSVRSSDVCKTVAESVSKFYRVNVWGEHVHNIAFYRKTGPGPVLQASQAVTAPGNHGTQSVNDGQ